MTISDVLIKVENKHGYKIQVGHPYIKPLYEIYKKKVMSPDLWWGYAPSDEERLQFECIIINMFRIGGADEKKRKEYFEKVIKGLKKLDFERMHANKKTDCITRARLATIGFMLNPKKA